MHSLNLKKTIKYLLITGGLALLFLIFSNFFVEYSTRKQIYDYVQHVPKKDIALVLGTSPNLKNGSINWYFNYRMNATIQLYNSGKTKHILVSGDNGTKTYNEPKKMKEMLIKNGIPAQKITLDYAGFRTLDSVIRAQEIFGAKSIVIISQQFHNQRALFIANHIHLDAVGFNAKDVSQKYGFKTKVREYFARAKAIIDIVIDKSPRFLGSKETINLS